MNVVGRMLVAVSLLTAMVNTLPAYAYRAPQSSAVVLQPGTRIKSSFVDSTTHTFTITLKSGQYLRLTLTATGTDINAQLSNRDGSSSFLCRQRRSIPISTIASRNDTYQLTLSSTEKKRNGEFVLEVETIQTATPHDNRRLAAATSFLEAELLASTWNPASWREAVAKYERARSHWRALGEQRDELVALKNLGALSYSLNDPAKALTYYDAARSICELKQDSRSLSEILSASGYVYFESGEHQRAHENATAALKAARDALSLYDEAYALDLLGEASFGFGNIRKAVASYQDALAIWQRLNDSAGQALALLHLGYAHSDLSETSKAFNFFNQALSLYRATKNLRSEGLTLTALGHLHSKTGEKQKALDVYLSAAKLLEPLDDKMALAMISNGVGYVLEELGQTKNALQKYLRALELYQQMGHRPGEVGALYKIGKTHFALGNKDDSLKYYERSKTLSQAIGDKRTEAVSTALIGQVYLSKENPQAALKYYEDAALLNEHGDDSRELAYTFRQIASIHKQLGNLQKAEEYFNKSLTLNRRANDRFGESGTLFNIAKLLHAQGKFAEAKTQIEAALRITESLRMNVASQDFRSSYVDSIHQQFELYVDVLMQLHKQSPNAGWDAAALAASERGRARSLLEMMTESNVREGVDPELLKREEQLQSQLDELAAKQLNIRSGDHSSAERDAIRDQIERLTADYAELEGQIRATSSHKSLSAPAVLKASEIQTLLDSDTAILEFALGDERSFAWVLTTNSIYSFELPARAEIEKVSREVYEALTARNVELAGENFSKTRARIAQADAKYAEKSIALSEMLLGRAWPHLKTQRIVVVADGILQYLSFAALPAPGETGKAVLLHKEVVSLPSASVLATQRQLLQTREPAPLGLAIFADPVFDAGDPRVSKTGPRKKTLEQPEVRRALRDVGLGDSKTIPRLPFSRREADSIAISAASLRPLQAIDFEANRLIATPEHLSKYRYLHFATHGLVNSEHPELSGILLSMVDEKGKSQNGFLKLTEISRLKLRADLIVLSACQTALGKEIKGEGLLSMTRGFMNAGAARVVASLWKVDDAATAELMGEFYKEIFVNKKTPAAALKAAQLHLSQQETWRSPYYWGGFVLQGEWR